MVNGEKEPQLDVVGPDRNHSLTIALYQPTDETLHVLVCVYLLLHYLNELALELVVQE